MAVCGCSKTFLPTAPHCWPVYACFTWTPHSCNAVAAAVHLTGTCCGLRWVLRKQPPGKLLRGAHQVDREYRVLKALQVPTRGAPPRDMRGG